MRSLGRRGKVTIRHELWSRGPSVGHTAGEMLGAGQRRTGDDGAAAVEFALISGVLFTLMFGIMQYGLYFLQATAVEHGLREGARLAAVGRLDCGDLAEEVAERSGPAGIEASSVSLRTEDTSEPDGYSRGDTLVLSAEWSPTRIGLAPLPGRRTETVQTSVEWLGDEHSGTCGP